MYPTSQTFKRWASHATVADLGEVLSICLDELRERIGPADYRHTLEAAARVVLEDEGAN